MWNPCYTKQLETITDYLRVEPGLDHGIIRGKETHKKDQGPEVGKVTLKSNGNEALNNEFLLKSNGDEALNDGFPYKNNGDEALNAQKKS